MHPSQKRTAAARHWISNSAWVADIHDECILGLDFLQIYNSEPQRWMSNHWRKRNSTEKSQATVEPTCYKVVLKEGVCIPHLLRWWFQSDLVEGVD